MTQGWFLIISVWLLASILNENMILRVNIGGNLGKVSDLKCFGTRKLKVINF